MKLPLLAMIAHVSDGSEADFTGNPLEKGIHLRWGFHRDLGFPLNGFKVYRRESRVPPILCIWTREGKVVGNDDVAEITMGADQLVFSSSTYLSSVVNSVKWQASNQYSDLSIPIPERQEVRLIRASGNIQVMLPLTPLVLVEVLADKGCRVIVKAFGSGRKVDQASTICQSNGIATPVLLKTSTRIDKVELKTLKNQPISIVRVCYAIEESCRNLKGWQLISENPVCLPVSHPSYPCRAGDRCGVAVADRRLPPDICTHANYGGGNLSDLLDVVRVVVDPAYGVTMGVRYPEAVSRHADAPPPEPQSSGLRMPALDLLLASSIDPYIARLLGLYMVDTSPKLGEPNRRTHPSFDYMVVGDWPEGTLWSLENIVGFDARMNGITLPPGFSHGGLSFIADSLCSIVPVSTNFAGASHALALRADTYDWNSVFSPPQDGQRWLFVGFPNKVAEVQIYARQGGSGLKLVAFHDGQRVAETATDSCEAILSLHAPAIDMVLIIGDLSRLYQVHYGYDYFDPGLRSFILYGITTTMSDALRPPSGVVAETLPYGLTRKRNDGQPLLSGAIDDLRYAVSVRWTSPASPGETMLSCDPLLFHIERMRIGSAAESCTDGRPWMLSGSFSTTSSGNEPRSYYRDVVTQPGDYKYRALGIDIFGRQSDPGPWSNIVNVISPPPTPPTAVTAKWLDPQDRYLTLAEKSWMPDNKAGLLVRWQWNEAQARQSPFIEKFHIALAQGWLNQLLGKVVESPSPNGDGFKVGIEFDRPLGGDVLAGMILSYKSVPVRILRQMPTEDDNRSTLCCVLPNSGLPKMAKGEFVAIPLSIAVRAKVESVESDHDGKKAVTVYVRDLRRSPVSGFKDSNLTVGRHSWPILSGRVTSYNVHGIRIKIMLDPGTDLHDMALVNALKSKTVVLHLCPPTPPFVDYGDLEKWPVRVQPVPAEGPGAYEVFIRQAEGTESVGRTPIAVRQHRILITQPVLAKDLIAYGQAAVASESAGVKGAVSSAAAFVRVSRKTPDPPAAVIPADDLKPVYASPPDYYGHSSYAYRWDCTKDTSYIVYRALDKTLFMVDCRVGPLRSKVRSDWDKFLNQFLDPDGTIRDVAFNTFVVRTTEPEYTNLSNRLLQILASFPDVQEAFTRLNGDPIVWNDTGVLIYLDSSLPEQGDNRYFYRIRAIDTLGNMAPMSVSTPPVLVHGVVTLSAPMWESYCTFRGRNHLGWRASLGPVSAYEILRVEWYTQEQQPGAAESVVHVQPAAAYAPIVVKASRVRFRPPDSIAAILGVYRADDFDPTKDPLHAQVAEDLFKCDFSVLNGLITVSETLADESEVVVVYLNAQGQERFAGTQPGLYAWEDEDVKPGVTYCYRIRPLADEHKDYRIERTASAIAAIAVPVPLDPPMPEVGLSAPGDLPEVTWPDLPASVEVLVQRTRIDSIEWKNRGDWRNAAMKPFIDDNVEGGTCYVYRLLIRAGACYSLPSSTSEVVWVP